MSYQTIVELEEFQKRSSPLLNEVERAELIQYLAIHPKAGDVIQGTGGLRKLRWAAKGKGKRGGSRVIYYFHNESIPLFLITIFGKNEKIDLAPQEKKALSASLKQLINFYGDQS